MEVFVDESGDLGFSKRSSKFFIVSFLFMRNTKPFRDDFRWLHLRLRNRHRYFHDELKFSQSTDTVRRKGLQLLCNHDDCGIGLIVVNKRKIDKRTKFYRDLEFLYRYVIVDTVLNAIIPRLNSKERLSLILDKRIPNAQSKLFSTYAEIKGYLINKELDKKLFSKYRFKVDHRNSKHEPCLQAADFAAGAEFHLVERKNSAYREIINDKIKEYRYWP